MPIKESSSTSSSLSPSFEHPWMIAFRRFLSGAISGTATGMLFIQVKYSLLLHNLHRGQIK